MSATLPPDLRSNFAKTIQKAGHVGEAGAGQALASLAVDRGQPYPSMSHAERTLRNQLRARGRQLGDRRDRKTRRQGIDQLAHEVAYAHWHRMLFARFLAENGLLTEPESGVAVSLEECGELAREQEEDPWTLAGRFAVHMLPAIFRPHDPALKVPLAPEASQRLVGLLESLPDAVFTASDSLGWTYQFWQAERKDKINASGVKIGARELPPVTQLFTERYMVLFLFHNTIGAWHAGKLLAEQPELGRDPVGEEELRRAARLEAEGGYDFSYLRLVRESREGDEDGEPAGPWRPAAGSFPGWPRRAAELRVLDPCCGSGHFLVEGLQLLVRLRMDEEGLALEDAVLKVLRDNLFGLEVDPRCAQIAAFNLAFTAWRMAGRSIALPPLNIACSGQAPNATEAEWTAVAESAEATSGLPSKRDFFDTQPSLAAGPLHSGMAALHKLFKRAPEVGSLLDPSRALEGDLFRADYPALQGLLSVALEREGLPAELTERAVAARGMAKAAELLDGTYTLVITNVPYLGRRKQAEAIKEFADRHFPVGKNDLATMHVLRIFRWLGEHGTQAVVTPQNWLFLKSYKELRGKLLKGRRWHLLARLGPRAFQTPMWDFNVALNILSAPTPKRGWRMAMVDVSAPRGQQPIKAHEKAALLKGNAVLHTASQAEQLGNPDAVVMNRPIGKKPLLAEHGHGHQGIATGDYPSFGRKFWEIPEPGSTWEFQQSTVRNIVDFGGREHVLHREEEGERSLQRRKGVRIQGGGDLG